MTGRSHLCGRVAASGFSMLEALIALLVVAFGLLALTGVNMKLARAEDVARQRGEATRLAQEKIEQLRGYTQITAAAGVSSWDGQASGSDTVGDSADYATNTTFTRSWTLQGSSSDPMRNVQVSVAWNDRGNQAQTLQIASVIAKADPADVGSLGVPLPAGTTLKRPKNRNLNIPVPAIDLGNGKSAVQVVAGFTVIFSNDSGYVVQRCTGTVTVAADLSSAGCVTENAYIVAGYVSLGSGSFPAGIAVNTGLLTGTTGRTCALSDATDQNTGSTISGFKYYLCVISVASEGAAWSGMVRLAAAALNSGGTNYLVCRFQYPSAAGVSANQRNVQPYAAVAESLDNQNYVLTTASSCPSVSSLATTLHQNCRGSNPNSNAANRASDCPAS